MSSDHDTKERDDVPPLVISVSVGADDPLELQMMSAWMQIWKRYRPLLTHDEARAAAIWFDHRMGSEVQKIAR